MNSTADQPADAAFEGDLAAVEKLIAQGADINAEDRVWNPLHAAVENEQIEMAAISSAPVLTSNPFAARSSSLAHRSRMQWT